MKIKIGPHDARMIQDNHWRQMNDWLAELRDAGTAGPPGDGWSQPDGDGDPRPEARAGAEAGARADAMARAVIGDQLRMPVMWCQMGSCISWHADAAEFGEASTRARAIAAGWRIDALGLACPGASKLTRRLGLPPGPAVGTLLGQCQGRREAAVTLAARPPRPPTRWSRYGTASTRLLGPCRPASASLITSHRLGSHGAVLDAARARHGYGGRRRPPMPVSMARAW